eukprot:7712169-Ditylum_brightwellii.AAC.1
MGDSPDLTADASSSSNDNNDKSPKSLSLFSNHNSHDKSAKVSATASALVIAAADKAGMENIDRARIDAIILRESGNSKFIQQQKKRDAFVNERIAKMKCRLDEKDNSALTKASGGTWKQTLENELAQEIQSLLSRRRPRSYCA